MVSDWRNFENWTLAGSVQAPSTPTRSGSNCSPDYTPPPLDPAIDEALKEYVAKRKAEGGVPGY
jgi:trimethylamine--corrinoid protein Co-methyltransferase